MSQLLDVEMTGGAEQSIPIQLSLLRTTQGEDTVGLKPQ